METFFFGNYDDYIDYVDRIASYTYWNNIGISGLACMLPGLDEVHKKQREI
jgi:hypothetical protein